MNEVPMEEMVDEGALPPGSQTNPGRRPLIMAPNKSQMLSQIRNSLSHLHKETSPSASGPVTAGPGPEGRGPGTTVAAAAAALGNAVARQQLTQSPMYRSREMTKSTPNLLDVGVNLKPVPSTSSIEGTVTPPLAGTAHANRSGAHDTGYREQAMQKIKQSLKDFQIDHTNGYSDMDRHVNEIYTREANRFPYTESGTSSGMRMTPVNSFVKINTSSGPIPYDQKRCVPIIDGRYHTGSPVSSLDTSSVRSESPRLASPASSKSSLQVPRSPDPRGSPWGNGSPLAASQQQSVHQPGSSPLVAAGCPGYTRRMSSPSDRLTPPPLPPRGIARPAGNGPRPSTPPPPVPPATYKEVNQRGVAFPEHHLRRLNPPTGPPPREAFRQSQGVMGNGPVVPQNGGGGNGGVYNNSGMNTPPTPGMQTPPLAGAAYRMSHLGGYPGQVHQQGMDSRGQMPYSGETTGHQYVMQQPTSHAGQSLADNSPLSSSSPSPAPTPSPGAVGQGYQSQSMSGWHGTNSSQPPVPVQAWGARNQQIIMHKAQSREVPKPKLQTATAPVIPPGQTIDGIEQTANYVSEVQAQVNEQYSNVNRVVVPSGIRNVQIEIRPPTSQHTSGSSSQCYSGQPGENYPQHMQGQSQNPHHNSYSHHTQHQHHPPPHSADPRHRSANQQYGNSQGAGLNVHHTLGNVYGPGPPVQHHSTVNYAPHSPRSDSPVPRTWNQSPMSVISTNSTPSTNSDIPDKPPPPYPGHGFGYVGHATGPSVHQMHNMWNANAMQNTHCETPIQFDDRSDTQSNAASESSRLTEFDEKSTTSEQTESSSNPGTDTSREKLHKRFSPIPQRKADAHKKDAERFETKVRQYSPAAFKFYMEQHIENVLKSCKQRQLRRVALEREMESCKLSEDTKQQMRKMLFQKESNHNRLKRAKMDKSLFECIKTVGSGGFGSVTLVRKKDTNYLYAMKTLRKRDVLQRNQVAHVKAERDILAEADCEWVVKLYYSFQDKDNLYFIMDYIPGGDMMALLIKLGIFEEELTRFYIAELVLAIESVHSMGFIHRDIKPDNILIDKDGHIKLTDFGLCTGFRWTHNSKYYQKGNHSRQDSMEPFENQHAENCDCQLDHEKELLKPLERRQLRHQRCQALSLVGTPNYIAPEVLRKTGYSRCCDWWSVGVIMYEMLVGSPPFHASNQQETQFRVINWQKWLKIPREARLSHQSANLIHSLLKNEDERLGRTGASEIKHHPFFASIKFDKLRQNKAPYIPTIRYATDTSNFDSVDEDKLRSQDSRRDGTLENGYPEHAFFEFTFKRFFDEGGHAVAMKIPNPNGDDDSAVFV